MKTKKLALIILVLLAQYSFSQVITDRPDQTESAVTVPKGSLQTETGIMYMYTKDAGIETKQFYYPTHLFRYGVFNWFELRLLTQYESVKNGFKTNGFSDIEVGAKFQLMNSEEKNTQIAFLTHVLIPSAKDMLTNDKVGIINKLAFSHSLSETLGLGYNIGYSHYGEGDGDLTYSMVLGVGLTDKLSCFFEPYGEYTEFEDFVLNFDTGLTYLIKDNLQIDCSFGVGVNNTMHFISCGISWNIPGKK